MPIRISFPEVRARAVFGRDADTGDLAARVAASGSPPPGDQPEGRLVARIRADGGTGHAGEEPHSGGSDGAGPIRLPEALLPANGTNGHSARPGVAGAPATAAPDGGAAPGALRLRVLWQLVRDYYRDPLAWVALIVFSVALTYGGGAIMFWFHAVYLQEGGPAIPVVDHWFLDSTAGFLGLTLPLAVIMPFVASVTRTGDVRLGRYALFTGGLFALVTAPGPIIHNTFISRGTWIANEVTKLVGNGQVPIAHPHHIPPLLDMAGQVGVGLPTYIGISAVALLVVRGLVRLRSHEDAVLEAALEPVPETGIAS